MMNVFDPHSWGIGPYWNWIIGIFVLVMVVWVISMVLRRNQHPKRHSALDILKERFARGEISKAEYIEKKDIVI